MINMYRILLMAFFAVSLIGCDELTGSNVDEAELDDIFSTESENDSTVSKNQLEVMGVEFTPGYKEFKVFVSPLATATLRRRAQTSHQFE